MFKNNISPQVLIGVNFIAVGILFIGFIAYMIFDEVTDDVGFWFYTGINAGGTFICITGVGLILKKKWARISGTVILIIGLVIYSTLLVIWINNMVYRPNYSETIAQVGISMLIYALLLAPLLMLNNDSLNVKNLERQD